jgi:hypothetical protein
LPTGATPGDEHGLIAAEASGRLDCCEFVEVEVVDGLQRLGGGAFLKVVGQGLEPRPIFGLEGEQDADSLVPALGTASAVGRSPVVDHRPCCGAGGAMSGLSLGSGHRFVAEGRAGHGLLRSVT